MGNYVQVDSVSCLKPYVLERGKVRIQVQICLTTKPLQSATPADDHLLRLLRVEVILLFFFPRKRELHRTYSFSKYRMRIN